MSPVLRRDCVSGLGLLPLEQRALPYAMISVEGQTRPPPKAKGPKAVRGQKRLSTLAEALPLAREIGAGSRAPCEIGAGWRGCLLASGCGVLDRRGITRPAVSCRRRSQRGCAAGVQGHTSAGTLTQK